MWDLASACAHPRRQRRLKQPLAGLFLAPLLDARAPARSDKNMARITISTAGIADIPASLLPVCPRQALGTLSKRLALRGPRHSAARRYQVPQAQRTAVTFGILRLCAEPGALGFYRCRTRTCARVHAHVHAHTSLRQAGGPGTRNSTRSLQLSPMPPQGAQ